MARLDIEGRASTFAATAAFKDAVLRRLDSLFTPGSQIWNKSAIDDVYRRFVENPDESGDSFLVKLQHQFAGAPDSTIQLMAELFYVHLLAPIDIKPGTKRKNVHAVLDLMDNPVEIPNDLDSGLDHGFLKAGMGFRSGRPHQLRYLIEFARRWIDLPESQRESLLEDPWEFKAFAEGPATTGAASQRNALLFFVFPDVYEAIVSTTHKQRIATAFSEPSEVDADVDRTILAIRKRLESEYGEPIDFYGRVGPDLSTQWLEPGSPPPEPVDQATPPAAIVDGKAWLIRPGRRGDSRMTDWLANGYAAIGWLEAGDISTQDSDSEIRRRVKAAYPDASDGWIRSTVGNIHRFMNLIRIGDLVVAPDGADVYVGIVTSDPYWSEGREPHRRNIEWKNADSPIERSSMSATSYSKMRTLLTVTDVSDDYAEFAAYAGLQVLPTSTTRLLTGVDDDLADELYLPKDWLNEIVELLREKRQVIFYGPPGTGKTYVAQALADRLAEADGTTLVQFHPSYTYEDFFEGYRPTANQDGGASFELSQGPLRRIADAAADDPSRPYFLIIDEINRANLAKVFGELYYLLEYRDRSVSLLYGSASEFTLPKNLFVIGTMNTADRSIAFVDAAMRRRFYFVPFFPTQHPVDKVLDRWLKDQGLNDLPARLLDEVNTRIDDEDFAVGPSYLMSKRVSETPYLERVWTHAVLPLLEEHFFGTGRDVPAEFGIGPLLAHLEPADQPRTDIDGSTEPAE